MWESATERGDGNNRDNTGGVETSYSTCVTTCLSINWCPHHLHATATLSLKLHFLSPVRFVMTIWLFLSHRPILLNPVSICSPVSLSLVRRSFDGIKVTLILSTFPCDSRHSNVQKSLCWLLPKYKCIHVFLHTCICKGCFTTVSFVMPSSDKACCC